MTKYRQESILLISAFALCLTLSSPAFAQCVGGRCNVSAYQPAARQAPQPTVRVVYPCQTAQACRPCQQATFAPFGGFFRNLFGCGWQTSSCGRCTAQTRAGGFFDSVSDRSGGACQPCQAEAPAACSACDSCEECPVEEEAETYEATEAETDADACSACEPVAPCGNVEDLTEIEAELIRLANAERGAVRCSLLAPDKNLFGWARLNSRLQASYCRTGHFSGAGWEISGGGYRSAAGVIKGWIDSAPHKAILLRNGFTKAGASVYQGRDGRFYWTMVFGN